MIPEMSAPVSVGQVWAERRQIDGWHRRITVDSVDGRYAYVTGRWHSPGGQAWPPRRSLVLLDSIPRRYYLVAVP
jgi:hypothetical protein